MIISKLEEVKKLPLDKQADAWADEIDNARNRSASGDLSMIAYQLLGLYIETQSVVDKSQQEQQP